MPAHALSLLKSALHLLFTPASTNTSAHSKENACTGYGYVCMGPGYVRVGTDYNPPPHTHTHTHTRLVFLVQVFSVQMAQFSEDACRSIREHSGGLLERSVGFEPFGFP